MAANNAGFDWDEANIAHIAEHDVEPYEAEEVVTNRPIDLDSQTRNGELRLMQIGETETGRVLIVVTTLRDKKTRVVTAWPANKAYRAFYAEAKEQIDDGKENPS
jgi:uncharacterized DUF497 family protein